MSDNDKETIAVDKTEPNHGLAERIVEDANAAPDHQVSRQEIPSANIGDFDRPIDENVNDLGWSEDPHIPIPVLYGIKNEDVWQLVRRFNAQTFHLKLIENQSVPVGGLDMNIADKDEFTPDKLKSTLERVYMTIGLSIASIFKHIARIRSWQEWKRTIFFFLGFLISWILNIVMPTLFLLITITLAFPNLRKIMFPPAPLSIISAKDGKAKVPKAGHLGSDGLTGAAESYKGQAVEQEAQNVVGGVAQLAVSTAIGNDTAKVQNYDEVKEENTDSDGEIINVDPTAIANTNKDAIATLDDGKKDHSEAPVKQSIWTSTQPILHALEDACDTWERFGNALNPTPPFPQHITRFRLAAVIAPAVLISTLLTSTLLYRSTTLAIGLAFFGQPLIDRMKVSDLRKWLDNHIPHWQRYLELRNSLLKGVPTNAQLTITLLRIGEAQRSPLPPPPLAQVAPPPTAKEGKEMNEDVPEEYQEEFDKERKKHQENEIQNNDSSPAKPKRGSKIMALFKGGVKAGAETALGTNRIKAEAGFTKAKQKVGVVHSKPQEEALGDGPSSFHARFKGKRGLILISTTSTTPCVSFENSWSMAARTAHSAYLKAKNDEEEEDQQEESNTLKVLRDTAEKARPVPQFSIQIDEIVSLKKIGGLGWKGKLIVGWALDSQITDGIEITQKDGKQYLITALPRRDEVFNRLASMGKDHQWEMW